MVNTGVPLAELLAAMAHLAPLQLAEDWDNVGLLVEPGPGAIDRVLTCLTVTPAVVREAIEKRARLIVTHHPVLFKPVQKLTAASPATRLLLPVLHNQIGIYSAHTAYDNAPGGVNDQLAQLLGLAHIQPLRPFNRPCSDRKIVVFVPTGSRAAVLEAAWAVGAGVIGNYHSCSYSHPGTGTFYGTDDTAPAVGQAGRLEHVPEDRVELICRESRVPPALAAIRAAHPYEEPAIDVYPLQQTAVVGGAGRAGDLPMAVTLEQLLETARAKLPQSNWEYVGSLSRVVRRVGLACGAAGEYLRDARSLKCDVFLTGESRFHTAVEAEEQGVALVTAGHYATERFAMENLARSLQAQFPTTAISASESEANPLSAF